MWIRIIASLIVLSPLLPAQGEFEVASVRLNNANDRIVTIEVGLGGRFSARRYTLVLLMQRAYGNFTGGPDWIRSDRLNASAKTGVEEISLKAARHRSSGSWANSFQHNCRRARPGAYSSNSFK